MFLCRRWLRTLQTPCCESWILDFPIAEQVIEVPKISCSPCPSRSRVPQPQSAEQLVEVPTVLSPTRIALRIAEQIVDTPVPRGRDRRRLQGSLPRQSSTATSSSLERISERTVEQIVDFPEQTVEQIVDMFLLLVVAFGRGLPHLLVLQMWILLGCFTLFPWNKVRSAGQVSANLHRNVSSRTPAVQLEDAPVPDSDEWMQLLRRRKEENEKELKAEEEEDEDPTGWTLAYDNYGRQYFWHRRTRRTAWEILESAMLRMKGMRKRKKK